jgi:hypothetical protein
MLQSRSGVAYVVMAIHMYCKCMFQMVQPFKTYIATVSSRCCICCSGYTRILQVCFQMLRLFHLDVAYVVVAIHVCCKCIL